MARILDISDCPCVPLEVPPAERESFTRSMLLAGGEVVARRPLSWPSGYAPADANHTGSYQAVPVEMFTARDATIGGLGAQARVGDDYLWARGVDLDYVRSYLKAGTSSWRWERRTDTVREVGTVICLLNFNQEYGHFILEILPKLFSIRRMNAAGIAAPILWPTSAPGYMLEIVRSVLPEQEIAFYDPLREEIRAGLAIFPGNMGIDHNFHPRLEIDLEAYAASLPPCIQAERIFVSRSGLEQGSRFRRLSNAAELEALARRRGFTILQPEKLPHRAQAAAFANARVVLGEFGSGMHGALFSPAGTKVIACNWITGAQSKIANLRGHDLAYQMPADGRPRLFANTQEPDEFEIDLDDLEAKLDAVL